MHLSETTAPHPLADGAPDYDVRRIVFDDGSAGHRKAIDWAIEHLEDAKIMIGGGERESDLAKTMIHADLMMAGQVIAEVRKHYAIETAPAS
jgi:heptaprenylglyceryl phosphate synthase